MTSRYGTGEAPSTEEAEGCEGSEQSHFSAHGRCRGHRRNSWRSDRRHSLPARTCDVVTAKARASAASTNEPGPEIAAGIREVTDDSDQDSAAAVGGDPDGTNAQSTSSAARVPCASAASTARPAPTVATASTPTNRAKNVAAPIILERVENCDAHVVRRSWRKAALPAKRGIKTSCDIITEPALRDSSDMWVSTTSCPTRMASWIQLSSRSS